MTASHEPLLALNRGVLAFAPCIGVGGLGDIGDFTLAPGLAAPNSVIALIALCYTAVAAVARSVRDGLSPGRVRSAAGR